MSPACSSSCRGCRPRTLSCRRSALGSALSRSPLRRKLASRWQQRLRPQLSALLFPCSPTSSPHELALHPSAKRKAKGNSDDVLKDGLAGAVLTKPEIIARLREVQEAEEGEGGEEGSEQSGCSIRKEGAASARRCRQEAEA